MSIKVSGTTVISDSRNLTSVGVATVGSGNSAVILNGNSGITNIGSGVTINGNTGDMIISGILTVGQLSFPIEVTSFSPAIGATNVGFGTNIILTLNQFVGLGTTGFLEIKTGSGTVVETIYPSDSNVTLTNGSTVLEINPSSTYPSLVEIFPVMSSEFIVGNDAFTGINTVGTGVTYSFTTKPVALGDAFGGGFLICQAGGTRWIVAPSSTQVARFWATAMTDSVNLANAQAACGDWFVPDCAQLQNPGCTCVAYWDGAQTSNSGSAYFSNEISPGYGGNAVYSINLGNGSVQLPGKQNNCLARAFRTVSY